MKKLLLDRRIQKLFLPASFVCILPLWYLLVTRHEHIPKAIYGLGILAAVFFILDRLFKPWSMERAEERMKKAQQKQEEEDALRRDGARKEEGSDSASD